MRRGLGWETAVADVARSLAACRETAGGGRPRQAGAAVGGFQMAFLGACDEEGWRGRKGAASAEPPL